MADENARLLSGRPEPSGPPSVSPASSPPEPALTDAKGSEADKVPSTADRRRRSTFALIGAFFFLDGLESGFVIPTLWLLLEKRFELPEGDWFLGAVVAVFCLSSFVLSPLFGKVADERRSAKCLLLFGCGLKIAGSTLWFLAFDKWMVFFGRALSGAGAAARPAMLSDVARASAAKARADALTDDSDEELEDDDLEDDDDDGSVYATPAATPAPGDKPPTPTPCHAHPGAVDAAATEESLADRTRVITNVLIMQVVGNVLGYVITPTLNGVDFKFFGVVVDRLTVTGLIAALLFVVQMALSAFLYFDDWRYDDEKGHRRSSLSSSSSSLSLPSLSLSSLSPSKRLSAFRSNFSSFLSATRDELVVVVFMGFASKFIEGCLETALFPFFEFIFEWTIFNRPYLSLGLILVGIVVLVALLKLGSFLDQRRFTFGVIVFSFVSVVIGALTWTTAIDARLRLGHAYRLTLTREASVGFAAVLMIVSSHAVCILASTVLSPLVALERQGFWQGIIEAARLGGNVLGPLWAGFWMNSAVHMGVQAALLAFLSALFAASWERFDAKSRKG